MPLSSDNISINEDLKKMIIKFLPDNFNKLSENNKKSLIHQICNYICKELNCTIDISNIIFNDNIEKNAYFSFHDDKILLNKSIITQNKDEFDFVGFLDNIIHETIHYCQKQNGLYLNDLTTPLPQPYYLFQQHEQDAYDSTYNILCKLKPIFSKLIQGIIDSTEQINSINKNNAIADLTNRKYFTNENDIQAQINTILPFYKKIHTTDDLKENEDLTIKLKKGNSETYIAQVDDKFYGIISIKNPIKNNKNKLYFTIEKNICFINGLYNLTTENDLIEINYNDKIKLINILNKILEVGNKNNFINCDQIEIVPISLTDKKQEYEQLINDIKTGKIKSPFSIGLISKKQIEKNIFNNEER